MTHARTDMTAGDHGYVPMAADCVIWRYPRRVTQPQSGRPMATAPYVALVFLGLAVVLALVFFGAKAAYVHDFGEAPPSRVNLLFWVPPQGYECLRQAVNLEDTPIVGTGVSLGEMCPDSQYAIRP